MSKKYLLIIIGLSIIWFLYSQVGKVNPSPDQKIEIQESENPLHDISERDSLEMIFFLEFEDFSCPVCQKQFYHFTDYIGENMDLFESNIIYVMGTEDSYSSELEEKRVEIWRKVNNIVPEIILNSEFKKMLDIEKSCIILKNPNTEHFDVFYLPLLPSNQYYIETQLNM